MTYHPPPPPRPDSSKRFLNMSGGVLMAVITGIILVCCIGPVIFCFASGILSTITGGPNLDPEPTGPPPSIVIDSCVIESEDGFNTAKITYTVTNNDPAAEHDYRIQLLVKNGAGAIVGDGADYASNVPAAQSVVKEATIYPDAAGGATCAVGTVS